MASEKTTKDPTFFKEQYRTLKRRFKFLVYENECYQEELRNLQRKLLKLSRDKNFLLDRLLQFEKVSDSSDDSDAPGEPSEPTEVKKQTKGKEGSKKKRPRPGKTAGDQPSTAKPSGNKSRSKKAPRPAVPGPPPFKEEGGEPVDVVRLLPQVIVPEPNLVPMSMEVDETPTTVDIL